MDYVEMMEALSSLDDNIAIKYREEAYRNLHEDMPPWYVEQSVEIKRGGVLCSVSGNGDTVEEAIEDHWKQVTELSVGEYVVVCAGTPNRKAVKWNGFMWKPVAEKLDSNKRKI